MAKPIAPSATVVADNIRRFQSEVANSPRLQDRLSYMRAWYAIRDGRGWLLGPSKFIGYEGFTAAEYLKLAKKHDGRKTEAHLQRWFAVVDENSVLHNELSAVLSGFLGRYGKAPSVAMRLNLLSSELVTDGNADSSLLDLLVAVARGLEPARLRLLKARVAAL
jgi:hypothetical protein